MRGSNENFGKNNGSEDTNVDFFKKPMKTQAN
jgi:hypothetical protein